MSKINYNILYIKNMVCPRCIRVIKEELEQSNFVIKEIILGKVEFLTSINQNDYNLIKSILEESGFQILDDKKTQLIEQVKIIILEGIRKGRFAQIKINISQYISDQVHVEYTNLSSIFSSLEGKSIERFLIQQKIEYVKELISYGELSIKQIADKLAYSSLQALSAQFKKETGLTPSDFKKLDNPNRKSLNM